MEAVALALALLTASWQSYVHAECQQIVPGDAPPGAVASAWLTDETGTCTLTPAALSLPGPQLALTLVHEAAHIQAQRDAAEIGVLRAGAVAEIIADRVTCAAAQQHNWPCLRRDVRDIPDYPRWPLTREDWRTQNFQVRK